MNPATMIRCLTFCPVLLQVDGLVSVLMFHTFYKILAQHTSYNVVTALKNCQHLEFNRSNEFSYNLFPSLRHCLTKVRAMNESEFENIYCCSSCPKYRIVNECLVPNQGIMNKLTGSPLSTAINIISQKPVKAIKANLQIARFRCL
jgi:hypothetical protein